VLTILNRYVFSEVFLASILSLALYVIIFLFGFFYASSRWLDGVGLGLILKWLAYHVPGVVVQVLPMALVTGTTVFFGRLAAEGGLLAIQAGGISFRRLALPAIVLGLVAAAVGLWLNEYVAPATNAQVRTIWWEEMHSHGRGLMRLKGQNIPLGNGLELYFANYDRKNDLLLNVRLQQWQGRRATIIFADRGEFQNDALQLQGYAVYKVDYARIGDLRTATPDQMERAVASVFPAVVLPKNPDSTLTIKTKLTRTEAIARYADAIAADTWSLSQAYQTAHDPKLAEGERRQAALAFHSKLALAAANLVLILVALPLAVRYSKSPGLSLGLSVLIVAAFYLTFLLFRSFGGVGLLPPGLAVWLPLAGFALWGWKQLS